MEKIFKLSKRDERHEEDIHQLVDDILPSLEKFFSDYNGTISSITYNSTYDFGQNTKISLELNISEKELYPSIEIRVSQAGSGFLKPSERIFESVLFIKGVSQDFINEIYEQTSESQLHMASSKKNGSKNKMQDLLSQSVEFINKWEGYVAAHDIFLF